MRVTTRNLMIGAALLASTGPAAALLPAEGVEATASTRYNTDADGPVNAVDGNPGTANVTSTSGPGGSGIGNILGADTFDESTARARALLPGTLGSYSHAGGFSPGFMSPFGSLDASATARTVTHWMAVSSDPTIASVGIDVLAFFDGSLVTARYAGANVGDLVASVDAQMHAIDASGQIYDFHQTGTLDHRAAFDPGLTPSATWTAAWSFDATSNDRSATLNYSEFFDDAFVIDIGVEFAWEVVLQTTAHARAPVELWAIADFFNSGDFDLTIDTPGVSLVQVTAVPLPGAAWLLTAALCPLVRRSKRAPTTHT